MIFVHRENCKVHVDSTLLLPKAIKFSLPIVTFVQYVGEEITLNHWLCGFYTTNGEEVDLALQVGIYTRESLLQCLLRLVRRSNVKGRMGSSRRSFERGPQLSSLEVGSRSIIIIMNTHESYNHLSSIQTNWWSNIWKTAFLISCWYSIFTLFHDLRTISHIPQITLHLNIPHYH